MDMNRQKAFIVDPEGLLWLQKTKCFSVYFHAKNKQMMTNLRTKIRRNFLEYKTNIILHQIESSNKMCIQSKP